MSLISIKDVLRVAKLARIKISDEEATRYQKEFEDIFQYISSLDEVDIDRVEPTSQVTGLTDAVRKDEIIDYQTTTNDLLSNVPDSEGKQIKVKRVL